MPFPLLPALMRKRLTDVTAPMLHSRNIRLLMLDFDNTIVPYTTNEPTAEMAAWLEQMNSGEIRLCVVSNSKNRRVVDFCRRYGLDCITHARKPFTTGIRACLKRYGVQPERAALVGDQIYTDTLGANAAGVMPILVEAICNHNFWLRLRHGLELPWIHLYLAKERNEQHEKH